MHSKHLKKKKKKEIKTKSSFQGSIIQEINTMLSIKDVWLSVNLENLILQHILFQM